LGSQNRAAVDTFDQAIRLQDMNVVTFGFHVLTDDQPGRFAITASRNWRFAFEGPDAVGVDLEDYHGN
jgi:proteic killer suppression protein